MTPGNPRDITATYSPLFRNHLTRSAVDMPPSLVNPVAQAEKEQRDSHLSVVSHTEKRRRVVLGLPESPTTATPPVPQNLKMLLFKLQTQAVNDRIPAKGCRHLLVKPWANGT